MGRHFHMWEFFPLVGKIFPPDFNHPVDESNQEKILEPSTPTEAALVGIAH